MRVKDLIKLISGFDGDAEVVFGGSDHTYRRVRGVRADQAEKSDDGRLTEFYGVQTTASIVDIVVLG